MLSMSILHFTRKNDLSKFKCWWENNLKTFHNARSMKSVTLLCIIVVVWWLQLVRRKLFFLWKVMPFPARIEKVATCMNLVRAFYKKKRRMYQASHLLPLLNMQVHRDLTILRREKKLRSTYGWAFEWQDMREKLYLFTSICKYLSNSIL